MARLGLWASGSSSASLRYAATYYDWSGATQEWKDAAIFPVIPESALRATLGILARAVAPGKPRPGASAG